MIKGAVEPRVLELDQEFGGSNRLSHPISSGALLLAPRAGRVFLSRALGWDFSRDSFYVVASQLVVLSAFYDRVLGPVCYLVLIDGRVGFVQDWQIDNTVFFS